MKLNLTLTIAVLACMRCVAVAQASPSCTLSVTYVVGSPALAPGLVCPLPANAYQGHTGTMACYYPLCSKHCASCSAPAGGKPICLATGNTYISENDLRVPGLGNGLTLTRTWNSLLRPSLSNVGMFGPNWRSTYEERIYVDDDSTIAYARGDGSVWNFVMGASPTFTPVAPAHVYGTYTPVAPSNQTAALFYVNLPTTTWILIFQNGEQRVFDGTSGNLLSIVDPNGNTTQLSYDASYRLVVVADPASRHLYFSYASATSYLVTSVTSDVGISLSYSYDNQGRLSQYTKPDNTTVSFQYNDANPNLITAVLDSNGKILESHTYDNQGRGLTSSRAGGVEAVTVTYPLGSLAIP